MSGENGVSKDILYSILKFHNQCLKSRRKSNLKILLPIDSILHTCIFFLSVEMRNVNIKAIFFLSVLLKEIKKYF